MSDKNKSKPMPRNEEEWRKKLDNEQFAVLREGATERAFTGCFWDHKKDGRYSCAGCGMALFSSADKYDSGSGWPSFHSAFEGGNVKQKADNSHGMTRIELVCAGCDSHLGHLFDDGPPPSGQRYCINSASLDFEDEA